MQLDRLMQLGDLRHGLLSDIGIVFLLPSLQTIVYVNFQLIPPNRFEINVWHRILKIQLILDATFKLILTGSKLRCN